MKIIKKLVVLAVLVTALPTALRASRLHQEDGIYPNQSAEYVRTLNRNASRDADAAFYNPAGLAFMDKKGLYVNFSSQTYYAKREHTMDYYALNFNGGGVHETAHKLSKFTNTLPEKYSAETTAPVLPDLNVIWKDDKWAAFGSVALMQAAPQMTYAQGLAVMDWGNLATPETLLEQGGSNDFYQFQGKGKAIRTEYYIGATAGYAYQVFNWLSAAAAARYIYATGNMKIQITDIYYTYQTGASPETVKGENWNIDTDSKGHGGGVILGSHFRPGELMPLFKGLEVALRYEYYLPLKLAKTTNRFSVPGNLEMSGNLDIFKDGTPGKDMSYKSPGGNGSSLLKATYPQTISMGASYEVLKNLRAEISGELSLRNLRDLDGRENDYGLGFKAGACLEWAFMRNVRASAGYVYNDFGIKDDKRNEADQLLRSHSVGAGLGLTVDERFEVSLGFMKMFFISEKINTTEYTNVVGPTTHYLQKTFAENRFSVAIGLTYRFLGDSTAASAAPDMQLKKLN